MSYNRPKLGLDVALRRLGTASVLCIFDTRLECRDEEATDDELLYEVLYFYPANAPDKVQLKVLSFVKSFIDICQYFDESPVRRFHVQLSKRRLVLREMEPNIWIAMLLTTTEQFTHQLIDPPLLPSTVVMPTAPPRQRSLLNLRKRHTTNSSQSTSRELHTPPVKVIEQPPTEALFNLLADWHAMFTLFYGALSRIVCHPKVKDSILHIIHLRRKVRSLRRRIQRLHDSVQYLAMNDSQSISSTNSTGVLFNASQFRKEDIPQLEAITQNISKEMIELIKSSKQLVILESISPLHALRRVLASFYDWLFIHTDISRLTPLQSIDAPIPGRADNATVQQIHRLSGHIRSEFPNVSHVTAFHDGKLLCGNDAPALKSLYQFFRMWCSHNVQARSTSEKSAYEVPRKQLRAADGVLTPSGASEMVLFLCNVQKVIESAMTTSNLDIDSFERNQLTNYTISLFRAASDARNVNSENIENLSNDIEDDTCSSPIQDDITETDVLRQLESNLRGVTWWSAGEQLQETEMLTVKILNGTNGYPTRLKTSSPSSTTYNGRIDASISTSEGDRVHRPSFASLFYAAAGTARAQSAVRSAGIDTSWNEMESPISRKDSGISNQGHEYFSDRFATHQRAVAELYQQTWSRVTKMSACTPPLFSDCAFLHNFMHGFASIPADADTSRYPVHLPLLSSEYLKSIYVDNLASEESKNPIPLKSHFVRSTEEYQCFSPYIPQQSSSNNVQMFAPPIFADDTQANQPSHRILWCQCDRLTFLLHVKLPSSAGTPSKMTDSKVYKTNMDITSLTNRLQYSLLPKMQVIAASCAIGQDNSMYAFPQPMFASRYTQLTNESDQIIRPFRRYTPQKYFRAVATTNCNTSAIFPLGMQLVSQGGIPVLSRRHSGFFTKFTNSTQLDDCPFTSKKPFQNVRHTLFRSLDRAQQKITLAAVASHCAATEFDSFVPMLQSKNMLHEHDNGILAELSISSDQSFIGQQDELDDRRKSSFYNGNKENAYESSICDSASNSSNETDPSYSIREDKISPVDDLDMMTTSPSGSNRHTRCRQYLEMYSDDVYLAALEQDGHEIFVFYANSALESDQTNLLNPLTEAYKLLGKGQASRYNGLFVR